ncbi:hypothetical protein HGP14_27315 [Rhizobium sp. P32RR-XVIII]|uniref:sensor histidine kinase n=1 Tax=Rhizobium sp. P32RR-XVIII TaxID=2726738 RepID=UPI001456566B|nr:ATP-binding protein [Rhizobium sp. P32RR-XVIII]NLS07012.1 hypothetical protein [Rhizobium sp. P32RR-XVIII]
MNGSEKETSFFSASPLSLVRLDIRKTRALISHLRIIERSDQTSCDQPTICGITNSATILGANRSAKALLTVAGEALPERMAGLIPETLQRQFADGLISLVKGANHFSFEGILKAANGNDIPAVLNAWLDGDERPASEVCVSITQVNQSNDQAKTALLGELAHAARISLLGELTASISHEVNQPLSSIVTSAEAGLRWLSHDQPNLEEVKSLLERIASSGKRAGDIIAALRGMARNTKPARTAVSLPILIDECALILRADLASRQVGLRVELSPNLPEVLADRTQILQVIVNLATNTAQAMSDGQAWNRSLAIRAQEQRSNRVLIEVEDSGPGVDPKVRDKLFESFSTTKAAGTGLGLAICRSIVEAHDSKIELQSSSYLGARFSFSLETAQAASASAVYQG